jgi:hypothetical protein
MVQDRFGRTPGTTSRYPEGDGQTRHIAAGELARRESQRVRRHKRERELYQRRHPVLPPGWQDSATIPREYFPETYGGGEGGTREQLGMEQGFPSSYRPEEGREWFNRLRDFATYSYNHPGKIKSENWMRAPQLGLTPEQYVAVVEAVQKKEAAWRQKRHEAEVKWREWAASPEALAGTAPPPEPFPEDLPELPPAIAYMLGLTDVAPAGYPSIPPSNLPEMMIGTPSGGQSPARQWFEQRYPTISGARRGGARPTQKGWRRILRGRFAPKIKTVTF